MEFEIDEAENLGVSDSELSELLTHVYVDGGFAMVNEAKALFEPSAVRQRGLLIGARDRKTSVLAGVVILVPPQSTARRLAQGNEVEMHLLGVKSDFRGYGLGKYLVTETITRAQKKGYSKMVLLTQESMKPAHLLYESVGFTHTKTLEKNGRIFLVYDREL